MEWFRFYSEALDDPKVQRLPDHTFKAWVNLLCLASKGEPRGCLPTIPDIAFRLRMAEAEAESIIAELLGADLLNYDDQGRLVPHGWKVRQFASDDVNERVRRHRERQRSSNDPGPKPVTLHATLDATPPDTDTDADTDSDSDSETEGGVGERSPSRARPPARALALLKTNGDESDLDWWGVTVANREDKLHLPRGTLADYIDVGEETERWENKPPSEQGGPRGWRNWMLNALKFAARDYQDGKIPLTKRGELHGHRNGAAPPGAGLGATGPLDRGRGGASRGPNGTGADHDAPGKSALARSMSELFGRPLPGSGGSSGPGPGPPGVPDVPGLGGDLPP